jgi:hypothetical protein
MRHSYTIQPAAEVYRQARNLPKLADNDRESWQTGTSMRPILLAGARSIGTARVVELKVQAGLKRGNGHQ